MGGICKNLDYNVAIIGSGQLGGRHLQGLVKSSNQLNIYVMDPEEKSLSITKQRYLEVSEPNNKNYISYHKNINDLPDMSDVAIIVTTADVRRSVIETLLEHCLVKYIVLEKVVFQKSDDFLPIQNLFNKVGTNAWVNCARRSYSFYKELKKELKGETLEIKVAGKNWGLACNSIHMIDLLVFLTGQTNLVFDNSNLNERIYHSKRDGYKELRGKFIIRTGRGDILEMIDQDSFVDGELAITVNTDKDEIIIDEIRGLLVCNSSNSDIKKRTIEIPLQSQITGNIVEQIIDTGESDLTPFDECIKYHVPMLDSFNDHFSKITKKTIKICPIT